VRAAGIGYSQVQLSGWPAAPVALRLERGGTVVGRALDSKGGPVAGVLISLTCTGSATGISLPMLLSTLTGKDGRFCFNALPYGLYRIETLPHTAGRSSYTAVVGKEPVAITLRR
ncbi:MAG: carboxypeptidase-like regulatory domain-containing protein, partial [Armatimonadota bacterium]|nr:carboxypeptidase-like regulatory domain-containing protein [Armatimonadota bacterium]